MRRPIFAALMLGLAIAAVPWPVVAQTTAPSLGQLSLEDLMNIEITSVSRKAQRAGDVAAAVFVITQEDIRRSGMTTIPDLLRLAPGVDVAQINSSNWAVAIRGFNALFSNKLLVLVDGRSVYKRNFSGVFWDAQDMVLDDIDRIEVIRGPGGAVWGANAVNGVINIVTKHTDRTQGALVRVSGGTLDRVQGAARYGGTFGDATYRVYSQWTAHGDTHLANGTAPGDAWDTLRAGARVDWKRGTNDWTLDGGVGSGAGHGLWNFIQGPAPGLPVLSDRSGSFHDGSALVRWTRHGRNGSTLEVQSTVAIARRSVNSTDGVTDNENAFDTAVQYHSRLGTRHDVVAGAGYRFVDSTTTSRSFAYSLTPADRRGAIVSVFGQDDIALTDRVRIALGAKVERDTVSGWSVQPTARFMWQPAADHHIWFSASRAIRTPSNTDLAIRINVAVVAGPGAPMVIGVLGNPDYQPEKFKDAEVGYRVGLRPGLSVDVTAFRGRYDGLQTNEPLAPVFEPVPGPPHLFLATRFDNRLNVDTSGLEVAVRFAPAETWRLDGTYSNIHLTPNLDARSRDAAAAAFDGNAPSHQWRLHSGITLGPRTEIDVALSRTGALSALAVPSHTRADARVEVRLTRHLSAALSARNLLKASHAEFVTGAVVSTQIPRSGDVRLVFRF